ncbi:hypothetical protein MRX96_049661 [Rhipicephalus microplus]
MRRDRFFPKWSSINYWEVRVVGDKSLQNFSVWLIIVGHVNNAPHGIVGRSEVGGDICAASAERDGSELGINPRPSLHRGAECEEEIAVRSVRGVSLVTSKPPRGRTTTLKSPPRELREKACVVNGEEELVEETALKTSASHLAILQRFGGRRCH